MDDSRILPFTTRVGNGNGQQPPDDDELVEPGNAYAVARGLKPPPALKFLNHDGSLIAAMPYAYLPIVWGTSPELVTLEYPGFFTMLLAGWNLTQLEASLCGYRVIWIRQSDPQNSALLATAITRIEIVRVYPSRQGA